MKFFKKILDEDLAYLLNQDEDGKTQLIKDIENPNKLIELAHIKKSEYKIKAHFYISADSFEGKQSKCKILGFVSKNSNEIDEFLYNYSDYSRIIYLYESPNTCKLLKIADSNNAPVFKKGGRLCYYLKRLKM